MMDKPMVWRKLSGKVRPVVHLHDEEKEEIEGIKRRRKKKKIYTMYSVRMCDDENEVEGKAFVTKEIYTNDKS